MPDITATLDGDNLTVDISGLKLVKTGPNTWALEGEAEPQDPIFLVRMARGFNQTADVSAVRFVQPLPLTDTTGLLFFNERAAGPGGSNNDGEDGMRATCCTYALDVAARTIDFGPNVVIDAPADWANANGSSYCPQPVVLPSGRIIVLLNRLRSATGKINAVPSYLDLYLFYSDDNGATWHGGTLIKTAESFYTENGLATASTSGTGLFCNGTNNIVLMGSGRIVLAGQANAVSGPCYLGTIYTDDPTGLAGWTWGTPLQVNATHSDNEQALTNWFGDTLRCFARPAGGNGRDEFSSPDGHLWTYVGWRPDLAIQTVNACAYMAGGRAVVAGSTDTNAGYRDQYKIYLLNSSSAVTATLDGLFPDALRVGYTAGWYRNGWHFLAGEFSSEAKTDSFNMEDSGFLAVFNDPGADGNFPPLTLPDSAQFTAAAEFATYKAWVEGDGGTIFDEAACLAAITRAIAGNYYSKIGFAISPQWGWKGTGAADTVLYSIGPQVKSSSVGISTSATFDTETHGYRVLIIPDSGFHLRFSNLVMRKGSTMGAMMVDAASPTNNTASLGMTWTSGGVSQFMMAGFGIYSIGSEYRLESNPQYGTGAADAVHIFVDYDASYAMMGSNGVDLKAQPYIPSAHFAPGDTATVDVTVMAGDHRHLAEHWFFNDGPWGPMRQSGEDAGAIY